MTRRRRPQRNAPLPDPQRGQSQATNPQLRAAIMEVVDTQLAEGNPPETRQTLDRLIAAGHTPEGARELIALVVVNEIFEVLKRGEVYDQARFIAGLRRLPKPPWETDDS